MENDKKNKDDSSESNSKCDSCCKNKFYKKLTINRGYDIIKPDIEQQKNEEK